jgi:hypothetical protein
MFRRPSGITQACRSDERRETLRTCLHSLCEARYDVFEVHVGEDPWCCEIPKVDEPRFGVQSMSSFHHITSARLHTEILAPTELANEFELTEAESCRACPVTHVLAAGMLLFRGGRFSSLRLLAS